jgi:hypothetical protein
MQLSLLLLGLLLYVGSQEAGTCSDSSDEGFISRHLEPSEYHLLLDDDSTVYVEYKQKAFLKDFCTQNKSEVTLGNKVPVQRAFGAINFRYKPKPGLSLDPSREKNVIAESDGPYRATLSFNKKPALFVMLNGQNTGVFVSYVPGQLRTIAREAAAALGVKNHDIVFPLRFFDVSGRPLDFTGGSCEAPQHESDILQKAHFVVHLLLDKELFVWPGISLGFEWTVAGSTLHTLALQPKVILARNFVPEQLCDTTISNAASGFSRSPEKHYAAGYDNYRTSQTATAPPFISRQFQSRAAILGRLPTVGFVEGLQLLKYDPRNGDKPGQWYKSHHDFYHSYDADPASIRERTLKLTHGRSFRENVTRKVRYIEPNRFLTFFPYLNNVEEGGETVFPSAIQFEKAKGPVPNRLGMPECSQGLSITPIKGAAALFYATLPDGSRDYDSRHGGCPPEKGTKHAANLFTWNYDVNAISPIIFG